MSKTVSEIKKRPLFPEGSAIVIGGSGGIGESVCKNFISNNVPVIFTYFKNEENASMLVKEVSENGGIIESHQLSLTDRIKVENFFEEMKNLKVKVHSIVNATGADIRMRWINSLTYEEWEEVMHNDSDGFFNLVKSSLPLLKENGGSYTTISSIGLSRWPTKDVLSVAPKAVIDALITGLAREEGRNGVRANSVQLGIIEAGIFLRIKDTEYDERYIEAAKNNTALKRLGSAEDVSDAVIFLSSNRANYITGQTIYLDGGFRI